MIAETFTGGILTARLSLPLLILFEIFSDSKIEIYSDFKPSLSAADLLDIYQHQTVKLFTTSN